MLGKTIHPMFLPSVAFVAIAAGYVACTFFLPQPEQFAIYVLWMLGVMVVAGVIVVKFKRMGGSHSESLRANPRYGRIWQAGCQCLFGFMIIGGMGNDRCGTAHCEAWLVFWAIHFAGGIGLGLLSWVVSGWFSSGSVVAEQKGFRSRDFS